MKQLSKILLATVICTGVGLSLSSCACKHENTDLKFENVIESNCTSDGSCQQVEYCAECGEEISREAWIIMKVDHTPGEWIIDSEPSCENGGKKHTECTVCHEIIQTKKTDSIPHNYVGDSCLLCGIGLPSEGLKFSSNGDGTCSVSGIGICTDKNIVIPSTSPDGSTVTSIAKQAFMSNQRITSVVIPNTVSDIKDYAFFGCSALESVKMGDSITNIGPSAFYACFELSDLALSDSLLTIGKEAFCYCRRISYLTIPDSVVTIDKLAFYDCKRLTSVTVGSGVQRIGENAFRYCYNLVEVINKSSLNMSQSKGTYDFGDLACFALDIHSGESKLVDKNDYLFYTVNGINHLVNYVGDDKELTLPGDYNGESYIISDYAFYEDSISAITIPSGVTAIGKNSFGYTYGLKSVIIPNSVITIGERAFDSSGLKDVVIGTGVKSIGEMAFWQSGSEIDNATFMDPNGWVTTGGDALNATDLSNTDTAGIYISGTRVRGGYCEHQWIKE